MTTIGTGGGPTIEERRAFSGLKKGAQLPGYRGYCSQLKYRVGNTYGNETHNLFKDHVNKATLALERQPKKQFELPDATGDNKYMKDMVPGYTGYVPSMFSKFGGTYKEKCDECVEEFITDLNSTMTQSSGLQKTVNSYPRFKAVSHDPHVRDHMNAYTDTKLNRSMLRDDRRGSLEPPMPGYYGYMPRISTTETGLGARYHTTCQKGLELFDLERKHRVAMEQEPITFNRSHGAVAASIPDFSRRLYKNSGMIPKYTGYIPQRRFVFGRTYGETTRSLDVCHHDDSCYGEYTRNFPTHESVMC